MAKDQTFAAIDVGTTKVCTIVGELSEVTGLQVLGVGISPTNGLRKGMVVNLEETTESIKASVEQAEKSSGYNIVSAHLGIAGGHVASLNSKGTVTTSRADRQITEEDVSKVLEVARTVNIPNNREILHVIPRSYTLDGQDGVRNPVGMHGSRLDVETHVVTGATASIQNLTKCVENLGIAVDDLVLQPLASSEATLDLEERDMGVALVDIGGGTTDIAIFTDGGVCHSAVLPVGGHQLTRDIAIGLSAPFAVAEALKIEHGNAVPENVGEDETVEIDGFGSDGMRSIACLKLSQIIEARLQEIFGMVHLEIKRSGYEGMLPAGIVLTGGTANLAGIAQMVGQTLEMPARIALPQTVHGLVDTVNDPAFATSVGLLLWGIKYGIEEQRPSERNWSIGGFFHRIFSWVGELLPQ